MSSEFEVVRSTEIAAPAAKIYAYVASFQQWRAWSPWEDADPNLQRTYEGPEGEVGATYAWAGNRKAGEGRMEVTALEPGRRVNVTLNFLKPFKATNNVVFSFEPQGEGTLMTWRMTGPMTLFGRVLGLFGGMDKIVGKDFEKGLANLKKVAEG